MFKGKKGLYILLPINLLVWGFIGYKIVMAFQGEDLPVALETVSNYTPLNEKDTLVYELALNYEDPFLKQEPAKRVNSRNYNTGAHVPAIPPTPKPVVAEVKPPKEIKYLGIIQNKTSGMMMALISINGNSYTIKKGDEIDGFSIKNITTSFIEIKEGKKCFKVGKG